MIDSFSGKYRFLSNFYPIQVTYDGGRYPTVEHAYQAAKTLDASTRLLFQVPSALSPGQAKGLGRGLTLRADWEQVKVNIMYQLLESKFEDEHLRLCLLDTGEEELIEGNTWGDRFWGVCNGRGENMLGRLLMQLRESLKS